LFAREGEPGAGKTHRRRGRKRTPTVGGKNPPKSKLNVKVPNLGEDKGVPKP